MQYGSDLPPNKLQSAERKPCNVRPTAAISYPAIRGTMLAPSGTSALYTVTKHLVSGTGVSMSLGQTSTIGN